MSVGCRCYHCNEPILTKQKYQVVILGETRDFCCLGCQAVASTIVASGLVSYYQHRTAFANKYQAVPDVLQGLSHYDDELVQQDYVQTEGKRKKINLSVEGISCAACAWLIEKQLRACQGVESVSVNVTTQRAQVIWQPERIQLSQILTCLHQLGYQAQPFEADRYEQQIKRQLRHYLYKLGIAGVASMQVMMLAVALYMDAFNGIEQEYKQLLRWVSFIFATPVLLYSASPFYRNAWRNLKALSLGMDVPVSIALLFAYIASGYATITRQGEVYFESIVMFCFFLLLGRFFELKTKYHAVTAHANLHKLLPAVARLATGENIRVKSLQVGMQVQVLAGETIPADGIIITGETSVNESMLTGESLPVAKKPQASVFAGTINIDSNITLSVSCPYQDSMLANVIQLQQDALAIKPELLLLADSVAKYFVAVILLTAAMTWGYWSIHRPDDAFWIMLSVLVATCPCALSLATPTAITCATLMFSRLGILVTKSHVFSTLTKVNAVYCDKTGTLTEGKVAVTAVTLFGRLSLDEAWQIAASLERFSSHPIANAFRAIATQRVPEQVTSQIGQGVQGILDGKVWRIGRDRFALANKYIKSDNVTRVRFTIYLSCQGEPMAAFQLTDPLRKQSGAFVAALKKAKVRFCMLTGDNRKNAAPICRRLGIEDCRCNLSAQQKMQHLQEQKSHAVTMMVGDGINDAPVLALAHLSVAMGSGTDIAKRSADMVLLNDELLKLVQAMEIAHFTQRIIKQNLTWALLYNALVLPMAVLGLLAPYFAVVGMSFSSVLVVLNSLRISQWKASTC